MCAISKLQMYCGHVAYCGCSTAVPEWAILYKHNHLNVTDFKTNKAELLAALFRFFLILQIQISCRCLLNVLYSCVRWQQNCSQDTDTFPLHLSVFFPQFSFNFPLSLSSPASLLFSVFYFLCLHLFLSHLLVTYTFLIPHHANTHTHTHRKELNSVSPLLLHYVNHHFPSNAASFVSTPFSS